MSKSAHALLGCIAVWSTVCVAEAQEPVAETKPRVGIATNSSVVRQHRPGAWSVLAVNATNYTDEAGEGLISVFFPPETGRQFARRVWVPAHAQRITWLPIRIPGNIPQQVVRQDYTALSLDPTSPREVLQRRAGEPMTSDNAMSINHSPVKTATLLRQPKSDGQLNPVHIDRDAWETLMAARSSVSLEEGANDMFGDFLPPWSQVLQGFDQFLLTSDRITRDAGGVTALRSWVRDGGRLWLTLDTLSPDGIGAILGNACQVEVVDRVELDQYVIQTVDPNEEHVIEDVCDFEVPVTMARVVTSATNVPCRVNGWPAAFWIPYGEGEILVTTLGPRGWRSEFDPNHREPTRALRLLATRLFVGREGRVDVKDFQPALQQRIGYRIPDRRVAIGVLGAFWFSLLGGVVILARRRQVEWLSWLVPVVALVSAGVLVGVGMGSSRSVPPTIAHLELLRIAPETNETLVDGLAAIYDQQTRPVQWRAGERFVVMPEMGGDSEVRREIWTEDDSVETQNATARAGSVGLSTIFGATTIEGRVVAEGAFGPEGLVAHFATDGLTDVADAVIVSPPANATGVTLGRDGRMTAGADQVLPADQFSAEALLTDEQRWRQEIMRRVFDPGDVFAFPRRHSVVFWCQAPLPAVSFPEGFETRGTSLAVVPLDFKRTPPGEKFRIPSSFLTVNSVSGRQGRSTSFNPRTGQWVKGLTVASETVLRFQLPQQVLPCRLDRGVLAVRINAPSRDLSIRTYQGAEPVLVKTESDPNGVLQFSLTAEQLEQDERGGVRVVVTVSPTSSERRESKQKTPSDISGQTAVSSSGDSGWHIDYVRLTVDGQSL